MRVIGISGFARAGKDTFFSLLRDFYLEKGLTCKRFALADALKQDIEDFLVDKVGISTTTSNTEEKKIIRPLLVEYGRCKRIQSDGKYWTSLLQKKMEAEKDTFDIAVITDIRYALYDDDEIFWLKNMGGKLIHISQYKEDGEFKFYHNPPNKDEAKNDPIIRDSSDYKFEWKTVMNGNEPDWDTLYQYVKTFLEKDKKWEKM